jgi:small subunit ribosomal protein S13e
MGRLHSKGKGIASSAIPYSRTPPAWLKTTPDQVVDHICKLAKKGATPSQIGVVLRDSHGVAQVKFVTGMEFWKIRVKKGFC